MKKAIIGIIILSAIIGSFLLGRRYPLLSPIEPIKPKVDTLFIRDTMVVNKPYFVNRTKIDSIIVPADTITMHDTLFVILEREQIQWRDSLCEVYASGVRVNVDSVRHYMETMVVEKTIPVKTHPRWSLGVSAGYGANKDGLSPYVGVGITYNILSW